MQSHRTGASVPSKRRVRPSLGIERFLSAEGPSGVSFSAAATVRAVAFPNFSYGGKRVGATALVTNGRFGRQSPSNLHSSSTVSAFNRREA